MLPLLLVLTALSIGLGVYAMLRLSHKGLRQRYLRYAGPGLVPTLVPAFGAAPARRHRLPGDWLMRWGIEEDPRTAAIQALIALALGASVGWACGIAVAGAIVALVALAIRWRRARLLRVRQMAEQLPDALLLIASAMRSGLGIQQALQTVGTESPAPLGVELCKLGADLALGCDPDEAIARLQERLASVDGEMLASALLVQRQTGGNLAEILVSLHGTIRDRQAVLGQVRSLTAMGRLSGLILSLLPVAIAIAIWLINRSYLQPLITDPRGQAMTATAVVLMLAGTLMIRRIVRITL